MGVASGPGYNSWEVGNYAYGRKKIGKACLTYRDTVSLQ